MSHDGADPSLPTVGLQSQRPSCLILQFPYTCLYLKEGKERPSPQPCCNLNYREPQAQFCRSLGSQVFSQLPLPICRYSSAQSLCLQPALDTQSRGWHCCHLVHGPDPGIDTCRTVQSQTSFHGAPLCVFRAWSTSGPYLNYARAQLCPVASTPRPGNEKCVTTHLRCGQARPFWDSELIWVPLLLKLLFQQGICQRELVTEKFIAILAWFS